MSWTKPLQNGAEHIAITKILQFDQLQLQAQFEKLLLEKKRTKRMKTERNATTNLRT